jgi:hypothetical protein
MEASVRAYYMKQTGEEGTDIIKSEGRGRGVGSFESRWGMQNCAEASGEEQN